MNLNEIFTGNVCFLWNELAEDLTQSCLNIWYNVCPMWIKLSLDCWYSPVIPHMIHSQQCLLSLNETFISLLTTLSFIKSCHNFSNVCFVWIKLGLEWYIYRDCLLSMNCISRRLLTQSCLQHLKNSLLCMNWSLFRLLIRSCNTTYGSFKIMSALCELYLP